MLLSYRRFRKSGHDDLGSRRLVAWKKNPFPSKPVCKRNPFAAKFVVALDTPPSNMLVKRKDLPPPPTNQRAVSLLVNRRLPREKGSGRTKEKGNNGLKIMPKQMLWTLMKVSPPHPALPLLSTR